MTLEILWFCLLAFFWTAYFVLEGFDFGVGMLLPVLGRSETDRGTMFEAIGPLWDGNEVWLVIAGGATFAAFPVWYATMFSGFYLALLLILGFLIVRVLSFEWREKAHGRAWKAFWASMNTIGSIGAPFLWGSRWRPRCSRSSPRPSERSPRERRSACSPAWSSRRASGATTSRGRCPAARPRSGPRCDDPLHGHRRRPRPDPALRAAAPAAPRQAQPHRARVVGWVPYPGRADP